VSKVSGAVNRHSVVKFPQCVVGITGLVLNRKGEENDNLEDEGSKWDRDRPIWSNCTADEAFA
jgi:hypothetical protein